jgi:hypothetical protein
LRPRGSGAVLKGASKREFVRPAEEDERRALRWLMDQREHGGPLDRKYAATMIDTLAYFEQEAPVDDRP